MSARTAVESLGADLRDEQDSLIELLAGLDDRQWQMPSAAAGWSIRDQVVHLAYFDGIAALAGRAPDEFRQLRHQALEDLPTFIDSALREKDEYTGAELIGWWRAQRDDMLQTLLALPVDTRLPWFGPDMSVRSKLTARLMETWAHGQDVVDALGRTRQPTDRLRHVAHLGVSTFGHSFRINGLQVPQAAVYVELRSPGGELWTWGDPAADQSVKGRAEDFCLVVTQRRDVAATRLVVTGETASRWMTIAQAFAGAPGARPNEAGTTATYRREGPVAWLTMNRPDAANALNADLRRDLALGFDRFNADTDARVLILTGAGKNFCAGGDLKEMAETGLKVPPIDFIPQPGRTVEVSKPIIAAVNGAAYGGGFLLAQCADLCIAADNARFAISEPRWGRGAPWAALLPSLIPARIAMELLLTADPLDADRALQAGLVNRVVPAAELLAAAAALATRIAANAPLSVAAGKAMVYAGIGQPRDVAFDIAERLYEPAYLSKDAQEGPRAFREGRSPNWTGT